MIVNTSISFYRYPAFRLHGFLKKSGVNNFALSNTIISTIFLLFVILCSFLDNSLVLENDDIGLLEHPAIYGWFVIIYIIPPIIFSFMYKFLKSRKEFKNLTEIKDYKLLSAKIFPPFYEFINFGSNTSKNYFGLLFTIGISLFTWNSYQNYNPYEYLNFNFWDSIDYPWGYFITRILKFYIFALLLPSVIHIFTGIVWITLFNLRKLAIDGKARLIPFGVDNFGGLGFIAKIILAPAIYSILMSSVAIYGSLTVHHKFDLTTVSGTITILSVFVFFYIIPTLLLRKLIIKLKKNTINKIYKIQIEYYELLMNSKRIEHLKDSIDSLNYYQKLVERIKNIPNWPNIGYVVGITGISISPTVITVMIKIVNLLLDYSQDLLKQS